MTKTKDVIHLLNKEWDGFACSAKEYSQYTRNPSKVTCGNCRRTKEFKEVLKTNETKEEQYTPQFTHLVITNHDPRIYDEFNSYEEAFKYVQECIHDDYIDNDYVFTILEVTAEFERQVTTSSKLLYSNKDNAETKEK
jgi:hypothetical protein